MIAIHDLSFRYGREPLFSGLSLEVAPGSICGLLGKNGAGKTTLLKLMAGLLFPADGTVRIMDENPARRSPVYLREIILLPEEFHLPPTDARSYKKHFAVFYPRFSDDLFDQFVQEFELEPAKPLARCSYGQKKKFLLAFGLATRCRLMLLDEPTNGLDIPSKSQFRRALAQAVDDERAFVISTHQARDLENLIDPVVILDSGRIVFNQGMEAITRRLAVRRTRQEPDPDKSLFQERTMDGFLVVEENRGEAQTQPDLETLFQTVISQPHRIDAIFNRGNG